MTLDELLKSNKGKWIAIGGNRWIDSATAKKVQAVTAKAIKVGCKIVTGGAEGVDHEAMKCCLKNKITEKKFRFFLPYDIQKQYVHYRKLEGQAKARKLLKTLQDIQKKYPSVIKQNQRKFLNYRKAANFRNSLVEEIADAAIIFKPEGSVGTRDAIKKFDAKKIPYIIFR